MQERQPTSSIPGIGFTVSFFSVFCSFLSSVVAVRWITFFLRRTVPCHRHASRRRKSDPRACSLAAAAAAWEAGSSRLTLPPMRALDCILASFSGFIVASLTQTVVPRQPVRREGWQGAMESGGSGAGVRTQATGGVESLGGRSRGGEGRREVALVRHSSGGREKRLTVKLPPPPLLLLPSLPSLLPLSSDCFCCCCSCSCCSPLLLLHRRKMEKSAVSLSLSFVACVLFPTGHVHPILPTRPTGHGGGGAG